MADTEFKPCHECGGDAQLGSQICGGPAGIAPMHFVWCTKCSYRSGLHISAEDAIKDWNSCVGMAEKNARSSAAFSNEELAAHTDMLAQFFIPPACFVYAEISRRLRAMDNPIRINAEKDVPERAVIAAKNNPLIPQQDDRLPPDVVRLVKAARTVIYDEDVGFSHLEELSKAADAFAGRVPYGIELTDEEQAGGPVDMEALFERVTTEIGLHNDRFSRPLLMATVKATVKSLGRKAGA